MVHLQRTLIMKHTSSGLHHRIVKHIHKHVSSHKKTYTPLFSFIALSTIGLFVVFFLTRGAMPHTSELAFTEHSILGRNAGSVIPASCNSSPPTDHFLGDCAPTISFLILPPGGYYSAINEGENYNISWQIANALRCDLYRSYDGTNFVEYMTSIPNTYNANWQATSDSVWYQVNCIGSSGTFSRERRYLYVIPRPVVNLNF